MAEQCATSDSFGTPGTPPSTPPTPSDNTTPNTLPEVHPVKEKRRLSRSNTLNERRAMRRERKKGMMKRHVQPMWTRKQDLKMVQKEHNTDINPHEQKELAILYKQMARDYWDRWQWEMHQRKEEISKRRTPKFCTRLIHRSCLTPFKVAKRWKFLLVEVLSQ